MKKLYLFILLLLLILVNDTVLIAQNPEWKVYTNGYNITCLANDGSDLWVGTTQELVQLNKSTGTLTFYNTINSRFAHFYINSIAIDNNGNKWIGTFGGGLLKFDGTDWSVYNSFNSELSSNNIGCTAIDSKNNLWMGASLSGLVKFDGINWTVFNTSNSGLPANSISSIKIDGKDNIWTTCYTTFRGDYSVTIEYGLIKFDNNNWIVLDTSNSELPSNNIQGLTIDNNGNRWIGTQSGLVRFDDNNWTIYDTSNSDLPGDDITCLAADNNGRIWIGITGLDHNLMNSSPINYGLGVFDGNNLIIYDTSNSELPSNDVNCILIDNNGNKWIGTHSGLAVFNEEGIVSSIRSNNHKADYPNNFLLSQNYPNPFNPSTTIKYSIPKQSYVTLKAYDILGCEVAVLVNEEKPAGNYEVVFHTQQTTNYKQLTSGVYFYQIKVGDYVSTKKMILLK